MEAGGIEPKRQPAKQAKTPHNAPLAIRKGTPMDTRVLRRTQKDKEFLRSAHQLRTDTGVRKRRCFPRLSHSRSPTSMNRNNVPLVRTAEPGSPWVVLPQSVNSPFNITKSVGEASSRTGPRHRTVSGRPRRRIQRHGLFLRRS